MPLAQLAKATGKRPARRVILLGISLFVATALIGLVVSAKRAPKESAAVPNPPAPSITVTKSHTGGPFHLGDTINYTATISNGGTDALNTVFSDTIDTNTTLVGGSLKVSPLAVNDTYNTIGNVNISVPSGSGVLANDLNPGGAGTLTVTQVNGTNLGGAIGTTHGSVAMNAEGSFTYNPTAGLTSGSDGFTYTLSNGSGSFDTGTVTINISGRIWFVNSAAGVNGDGRLASPFNILTGAGSADSVDAANDVLFLYSSATNYTGGMTLNSGEKIIGQGPSQSVLTITGFSAPHRSSLIFLQEILLVSGNYEADRTRGILSRVG